jgi:hypothetical protein
LSGSVPVNTWQWDWDHKGYLWLQSLLNEENSRLGTIQQVRWDAICPDRSRENVLDRFVADVAQLRRWLGPIDKVLATGPHGETHYDPFAPKGDLPEIEQLAVHLGTRTNRSVTWSVVPGKEGDRITLVGTGGEAVLNVGPRGERWTGTMRVGEEVDQFEFAPGPIRWLGFMILSEGESLPPWLDSCRDLEVVEAIDRSLLRGRTVAVHAEETTEAESFKGAMASGGCIILMLVLLAFLGVLAVEGLKLPIRSLPIWKAWPAVLVLLVLLFLGLQSLQVLVKRGGQEK